VYVRRVLTMDIWYNVVWLQVYRRSFICTLWLRKFKSKKIGKKINSEYTWTAIIEGRKMNMNDYWDYLAQHIVCIVFFVWGLKWLERSVQVHSLIISKKFIFFGQKSVCVKTRLFCDWLKVFGWLALFHEHFLLFTEFS
jgi:hypothetical protein